jgi:hypothetical protein
MAASQEERSEYSTQAVPKLQHVRGSGYALGKGVKRNGAEKHLSFDLSSISSLTLFTLP